MPRSVEDVRFRMERVRLGGEMPCNFASSSSGFVYSGDGDGGMEDSFEAGVISKVRRGIGLRICGVSDII